LTGVTLTGVNSADIYSPPASLPANWTVTDGSFVESV